MILIWDFLPLTQKIVSIAKQFTIQLVSSTTSTLKKAQCFLSEDSWVFFTELGTRLLEIK